MLPTSIEKLNKLRIVLATGAPQRIEILKKANIIFSSISSGYEEKTIYEEVLNNDPSKRNELVKLNANHKADIVCRLLKDSGPKVVIGIDTMVFNNNEMMGKPKTFADAREMLKNLAGHSHEVLTAVVVYCDGKCNEEASFVETTTVTMNELTDAEIDAYVETGEPLRCAGGYAIQGMAATFINKIDGDYYNVVGLPLCKLMTKLEALVRKSEV